MKLPAIHAPPLRPWGGPPTGNLYCVGVTCRSGALAANNINEAPSHPCSAPFGPGTLCGHLCPLGIKAGLLQVIYSSFSATSLSILCSCSSGNSLKKSKPVSAST